jgi:1-aminocyclopropane-1-carboxylate deaminase/D-cysteine desulfhydrase-like pyridoxal-dependent ACC family enzyme
VLRGQPPQDVTGNLLLDHLLGTEVYWSGERSREAVLEEVVTEKRAAGQRVYAVPLGGSTPLGAAGYALAMLELHTQAEAQQLRFNRHVFASSSGGTQAGLVVGADLAGEAGEVLGISVDMPAPELRELVARIATGAAALVGALRVYAPEAIHVNADYLGGGYAVMGAPEREAIQMFAQLEGILVDPVYTGRAAAGLIDLIRRGVISKDETVLFWHTGGTPALYAYAGQLMGDQ